VTENQQANQIITLEKPQFKSAAEMLTHAFFNDSTYLYWYPDSQERARRAPGSFISVLKYALRYGINQVTSPNLEGTAVWLRPEYVDMSLWRLLLSGALRHAFDMGYRSSLRMIPLGQYITKIHHQDAPFPHWYLQILGVDPKYQGNGYGGRLLGEGLIRADRDKLPCYVTTNTEKNVGFYEHHGFKVIREFVVPGTDFKNWSLLRK